MSLIGQYDADNIFAKIVRGEAPAARVFEDADTLAFLDVFPQARGHTLVVHKTARARNLLDIDRGALNAVMATVQRVARAINLALKPNGIAVSQFSGASAGQTVFHLHVHIIPRWDGVVLGKHGEGAIADPRVLAETAAEIAIRIGEGAEALPET